MADLPKNIWAWMDADGGIPESGEWCGDKIAEYDTEYVRVDVAQAERDALIADNAMLRERGPIDWRDGPPTDDLKDGSAVLLDVAGRVVFGRCYMRNYTQADTSHWWNFDSHGCDQSRITRHCPVTS